MTITETVLGTLQQKQNLYLDFVSNTGFPHAEPSWFFCIGSHTKLNKIKGVSEYLSNIFPYFSKCYEFLDGYSLIQFSVNSQQTELGISYMQFFECTL